MVCLRAPSPAPSSTRLLHYIEVQGATRLLGTRRGRGEAVAVGVGTDATRTTSLHDSRRSRARLGTQEFRVWRQERYRHLLGSRRVRVARRCGCTTTRPHRTAPERASDSGTTSFRNRWWWVWRGRGRGCRQEPVPSLVASLTAQTGEQGAGRLRTICIFLKLCVCVILQYKEQFIRIENNTNLVRLG